MADELKITANVADYDDAENRLQSAVSGFNQVVSTYQSLVNQLESQVAGSQDDHFNDLQRGIKTNLEAAQAMQKAFQELKTSLERQEAQIVALQDHRRNRIREIQEKTSVVKKLRH
jgi:exonuclease VII small subunit